MQLTSLQTLLQGLISQTLHVIGHFAAERQLLGFFVGLFKLQTVAQGLKGRVRGGFMARGAFGGSLSRAPKKQ